MAEAKKAPVKRKKAEKQYKIHVVKEGETLHMISQLYGVRMNRLKKMNSIQKKQTVQPGMNLRLR